MFRHIYMYDVEPLAAVVAKCGVGGVLCHIHTHCILMFRYIYMYHIHMTLSVPAVALEAVEGIYDAYTYANICIMTYTQARWR